MSTEIATTNGPAVHDHAPIASIQLVNQSLDVWANQLRTLGGASFEYARFKAIVISCVSRTPKLLECTRYSIRQSVQAAAELGLELGGVNGEAYLIPYKNRRNVNGRWIDVYEAQFMAGYKGYLRLAHESGLFRRVFAHPIFEADEFEAPERGPNGVTWRHRENAFAEPAFAEVAAAKWDNNALVEYRASVPKLKGAYAVAQVLDSRTDDIVKVVPAWRLEQIRLRSKAGKDGPWISDYAEMAAKTAMRALWKQLPKSDRMKKLEEHDRELDVPELRDADVASMFAGQAAEPPKKLSIGEKVKAKAAAKGETKQAKREEAAKAQTEPAPSDEAAASTQPAPAAKAAAPPVGKPETPRHDPETGEVEDDQYPDGDPDRGP